MNIFELELWDDEGKKCTFYTVRQEGAEFTETDGSKMKLWGCQIRGGWTWAEACGYARRIDEALRNGEIIVDKRRIIAPDGNEIISL